MPKRKNYVAITSLLVACTLIGTCRATTVIIFITPTGIVIGSDGLEATFGKTVPEGRLIGATKIVLVQKHLVIASVGLSSASDSHRPGPPHYEFTDWVRGLQERMNGNFAVDDFASLVENQSAELFTGFDAAIRNGFVKKEHPSEKCRSLVDYIVAGYKNKVPMVFLIDFNIDWQSQHLVGPDKILVHPTDGTEANRGLYMFGFHYAIKEWFNPKSYAYKRAAVLCPDELRMVLNRKTLTVDQAVKFVRALIDIEKEVQPDYVGGETMTATIPIAGNPSVITYPGKAKVTQDKAK